MPREASCAGCHEDVHVTFREPELEIGPELHACSGFALEPPHEAASCADCHDPQATAFEDRYPARAAEACTSCHESPHGLQFDDGPFSGQECTACHATTHFEPHEFTAEKHARTALPLTDSHLDLDCGVCHEEPPAGEPRLFHGIQNRCEECHADAHRGFEWRAPLGELAERFGDCAECHRPSTFTETHGEVFEHGKWTGFEVAGAHAQGACEECHVTQAPPDEHGRVFGWIQDLVGPVESCASCHADPHEGIFDRADLPANHGGREDCLRCHDDTSFRSFPHGFDHGMWTGFDLTGAHATTDCESCHAPMRKADERGRTWRAAKGDECVDCHSDPHLGQFEENGTTRCDSCHRGTERFSDITFRHNYDSSFRLDGAHQELGCAACHKPFTHAGREVIRFKPLGRECVDCHGAREESFLRRRRRKG